MPVLSVSVRAIKSSLTVTQCRLYMKTTVIYHSADFDGLFCREIAKKFIPDATLIGWNFGDPKIPVPEGQFYILDLSPECLEPAILPMADAQRMIWIDHHATAIAKFPKAFPGYRIDGVAACRLAWQWFSKHKELFHPTAGSYVVPLPTKEDFIYRKVSEPLAVRLAGEYDVWDKRDPSADTFQFGLRSRELTKANWRDLLDSHYDVVRDITHELLGDGQLLQTYQQRNDAEIIEAKSFDLCWEGLLFLALNTARCNSLTFAAAIRPEHDGLISFCFNGKVWTVSLYGVPGKPDVDLSAIAVKEGGGGHKQACGFTCETLPFEL